MAEMQVAWEFWEGRWEVMEECVGEGTTVGVNPTNLPKKYGKYRPSVLHRCKRKNRL